MLMEFFRSRMNDFMQNMNYRSNRQFALDKGLDVQRFTLYMKQDCTIVPGLDFLQELKDSCPELNLNWLVTGTGIPYRKEV